MSFTTRILLGLLLGIATGLFLGEFASPFNVAGEVFIALLQMTVLPYILVSLVGNLGTYIILMFVPFSAWYLGRGMEGADLMVFQAASLLSSFVAPIIGIPFLLDVAQLPADMMDLFVVSTVYTDRVRVVLGAMHLLCLTIVAVAVSRGHFRVRWLKLGRVVLLSTLAIGAALLGIRLYLDHALQDSYVGDSALTHMRWMEQPVATRVYRDALPPADPAATADSRLRTVPRRGALRVGYLPDTLPFAFTNDAGEVVGFDIELAHKLARDLSVELELVRIDKGQINALLDSGQIDIVMSGLAQTPGRALRWHFAGSPMHLSLGLLVPDHRRRDFESLAKLRGMPAMKLGMVLDDQAFREQLTLALPQAEIHTIRSPREFLRGQRPELDAVVYSAQAGSAWTLIYPGFSVVVPQGTGIELPIGYPVPRDDAQWQTFVSQWVTLSQKDGTVRQLYAYWILGEGARSHAPRWSIIRDVLHWVD